MIEQMEWLDKKLGKIPHIIEINTCYNGSHYVLSVYSDKTRKHRICDCAFSWFGDKDCGYGTYGAEKGLVEFWDYLGEPYPVSKEKCLRLFKKKYKEQNEK